MIFLSRPRKHFVRRAYGNDRSPTGEPLPPIEVFEDACVVCACGCGTQARFSGPVTELASFLGALGWRYEGALFVCGPLCVAKLRGGLIVP